jgi:hypothetical protein
MTEVMFYFCTFALGMILGYFLGMKRVNLEVDAFIKGAYSRSGHYIPMRYATQEELRKANMPPGSILTVPDRRPNLQVGPSVHDVDAEDDGVNKLSYALTNPLIWLVSIFLWCWIIWAVLTYPR